MNKEETGIAVKVWEETTLTKSQAVPKRRAKTFFTTMSVYNVDDDEHGPGEVYHAERVLANGDFYTGQWADNLPHGQGKYLWTDGCMYVGEWYRGKTMGKGKFSWPSGATYEGDFKGGYMDGIGTYTGSVGNTYKGSWIMNLKHGKGTKSFSNGDYYEGEWRRGLQDGHGRYQWKNGNHYIGQWKNGMINGNGTMIWSCGNRYDGFWEDGLPKGNGTFRWADGSFYVGVWSKDPKEQNGTYYPSGSPAGDLDWDPQHVYLVDLTDSKICQGEKISILPSQKMTNWPGIAGEVNQKQLVYRRWNDGGRPKRMSVDERLSNYSLDTDGSLNVYTNGDVDLRNSEEGMENLQLDDLDSGGGRVILKLPPTPKKQGETIARGHKNYELMLNLQLGIRHSVGRPAPATSLDLKASAFDPKEKVWTKFPPEPLGFFFY